MILVPPISVTTKLELNKRLRKALIYICLFILFRTVFVLIIPYYIHNPKKMEGPIDAHVAVCKCFDPAYVQQAKTEDGYVVKEYFQLYLPLDIVFPVLYTLMFLTIINVFKNKELYYGIYKKLYHLFFYLVFAGMIFDYLENITFSWYLKSNLDLSSLIAFLTTIKTFLFIINGIGFLVGFIIISLIALKNRKLSINN